MSKFSKDDEPLVEFLRQNSPDVPPPAPNLEEQIMAAIEQESSSTEKTRQLSNRSRRLWLVPPVLGKLSAGIAAGLLMTWTGYRVLIPATNTVDTPSLEAFVENNWDGIVGEIPREQSEGSESDWWLQTN
jgi:hypothetical protein